MQARISPTSQQFRRWGRRIFDTFFSSCDPAIVTYGKESSWNIQANLVAADSIVLSAGVGKDISFERELVAERHCRILLLDPSPTGAETMAKPENRLPAIEFLPIGLAQSDGNTEFLEPTNPAEGSYQTTATMPATHIGRVNLPCRSVSSLARERGWPRIDLLKMDIEGFEYGVIEDIIASGIHIGQLCVEFHHFMPGISMQQTWRAVLALHRAGLHLVHKHGCDYTFVHTA